MKVTSVEIEKGVCISTGSYETIRISKRIRVDVSEGDNVAEVTEVANSAVDDYLLEQVDSVDQKGRQEKSRAKRFGLVYSR